MIRWRRAPWNLGARQQPAPLLQRSLPRHWRSRLWNPAQSKHQRSHLLRSAMRRLAERMDNTIAGVARSHDEQNWDDLLRLIQDTISKPRDIGNAMELARRAVDVDKVLQVYHGVLNTLAECNSLLRGLIGEEKQ